MAKGMAMSIRIEVHCNKKSTVCYNKMKLHPGINVQDNDVKAFGKACGKLHKRALKLNWEYTMAQGWVCPKCKG